MILLILEGLECGTQGKRLCDGTRSSRNETELFVVDPDGYKVKVIRKKIRGTKNKEPLSATTVALFFMKPFTKKECFREKFAIIS